MHLGQDDGSIAAAREIIGGGIVGRTTRGGEALARGRRRGRRLRQRVARLGDRHAPDAAGRSASAPSPPPARAPQLPWFALGGIDERRALRVAALGARRIAVVRAVTEAGRPGRGRGRSARRRSTRARAC